MRGIPFKTVIHTKLETEFGFQNSQLARGFLEGVYPQVDL